MGFTDAWYVTARGVFGTVPVVTTFTYECVEPFNATPEAAEELLNSLFLHVFQDGTIDDLGGSQFSPSRVYTELEAYNLSAPTAFTTRAISVAGSGVGEALPSAIAYGFFSNRARRDIKRGFKRLPGPLEQAATVNTINGPNMTSLQNLGNKMAETINDGEVGALNFKPVVIGRVKYVASSGKEAYRLPETSEEYRAFDITSWTPYGKLSTQVTRKRLE